VPVRWKDLIATIQTYQRVTANSSLEWLAHATANKDFSPASPLHALTGCWGRLQSLMSARFNRHI